MKCDRGLQLPGRLAGELGGPHAGREQTAIMGEILATVCGSGRENEAWMSGRIPRSRGGPGSKLRSGAVIGRKPETLVPTEARVSPCPERCQLQATCSKAGWRAHPSRLVPGTKHASSITAGKRGFLQAKHRN